MPVLTEAVLKTILDQNLFTLGEERILCAVSGGPDSIAMVLLLRELGVKIGIAHCNFKLRDESDAEADFVKSFAEDLGVTCHVASFNTNDEVYRSGESVQMVARRLRYEFFETLLFEHDYTHCATAHTADDQVETILLSLVKGGGQAGWKTIPYKRDRYVRPVADCFKDSLLEYLDTRGQAYCLDKSNLESKYLRNKIRNQVLPVLKEINPSVKQRLLEVNRFNEQKEGFLQKTLENVLQRVWDGEALDLGLLEAELKSEHRQLLLHHWRKKIGLEAIKMRELMKLVQSRTGSVLDAGTKKLYHDRGKVYVIEQSDRFDQAMEFDRSDLRTTRQVGVGGYMFRISLGMPLEVEKGMKNVHYLDIDKICFPIRLRCWGKGDRMQPLGMTGKKKLSDIFIDEKWPGFQKARAVVFEDEKQIICLPGFRIADEVKLSSATKSVLKIEVHE